MALKVNGGDGRTSTLQEHTAVIQHEGQQRAQADKAQWHSWRWGRGGGSHNWALETWERANPGRQPGVTLLTLCPARPIPSSSAPCSYLNLPLGGVDELQALTTPICVPGAKMVT